MTLDELRGLIEQRLIEARLEVDRLQAALDALAPAAADRAPAVGGWAGEQPRARAGRRRRRAPRGATRQAVLEALVAGDAMTAGELAAASGLRRQTIAPELSKLVKTGELVKADRGYRTPTSETSSRPASTSSAAPNGNATADKPPAVRAVARELDAGLRTRS
jgi:hypothetical protein